MLAYVRRSPTLGVDRVEVRTATFDDAPLDAGVADAGTPDAGMADAGTADALIDAPVAVVDGGADVVRVVDVAIATDVAGFVDVASDVAVLAPLDAPRVAVDAAAAAPGDAAGCSVAGEPGARPRPARGALALGSLAFAACVGGAVGRRSTDASATAALDDTRPRFHGVGDEKATSPRSARGGSDGPYNGHVLAEGGAVEPLGPQRQRGS